MEYYSSDSLSVSLSALITTNPLCEKKRNSSHRLDGRITLKDFERQAPRVLGERINILSMFYPSNTESSDTHHDQTILELRNEVAACHSTIQELQNKIITCEKSQRLANEIELEYEDILKFLYDQLNQLKTDETNQLKHLKANDQLIQKLFHHLSTYVHEPNEEQLLAQLKYEYEQQKKVSFAGHEQKSSKMKFLSANKS